MIPPVSCFDTDTDTAKESFMVTKQVKMKYSDLIHINDNRGEYLIEVKGGPYILAKITLPNKALPKYFE